MNYASLTEAFYFYENNQETQPILEEEVIEIPEEVIEIPTPTPGCNCQRSFEMNHVIIILLLVIIFFKK